MTDQEILSKVNTVINEQIRPSLEMDGGGIEVLGLEGKVLSVHLQGACSGCPHAAETLKNGVERVLKALVDEDIVVSAI